MRVKDLGTRHAPNSISEMFSRVVRGHAPSIVVPRRELPYWRERGWTCDGTNYSGSYQTPYGAFQGWITQEAWSGNIDFFLYNPPPEIRSHAHWVCFAPRGGDWFLVHMERRPKDVSSGIIAIERLITEAFEQ
jgi:hypothetical protein